MSDTPAHIYEIQLKIWLSKSPQERLMQFLKDNEAMFNFCKIVKENNEAQLNLEINKPNTKST